MPLCLCHCNAFCLHMTVIQVLISNICTFIYKAIISEKTPIIHPDIFTISNCGDVILRNSLSLTHTLSLSLTFSHTISHTLFTYTHSLSSSFSFLSFTFSLSHTHALSLSLSLSLLCVHVWISMSNQLQLLDQRFQLYGVYRVTYDSAVDLSSDLMHILHA